MIAAIIIGFVLLLTVGALYLKFLGTPAGLWKQHYQRHIAGLRRRLEDAEAAIRRAAPKITSLSIELFERQVRALGPDALIEYAGIGPATVERLRTAGLRTVREIERHDLEKIGGIGPVKSREILDAVQKVLADARSRFEAAASREGQEFRRRLDSPELAAERAQREVILRESNAIAAAITACAEFRPYAEQVTFWRFLCGQGADGLPEDVRLRPFPTPQSDPRPALIPPAVLPPAPLPSAEGWRPEPQKTPPPAPPPVDIFINSAEVASSTSSSSTQPGTTSVIGIEKLRAVCGFGLAIAKADGRLAQAERRVIREFAGAHFGHDSKLLRHLDPTLEQVERAIPTVAVATAIILRDWPQAPRPALLEFAEAVTDATGGNRSEKENEMLAMLAGTLGVAVAVQEPKSGPEPAFRSESVTNLVESPLALLEIEPGTELSAELIRRRYTLLSEKLNPTRAAALGAEFAAMAEKKRAAVRTAAETLIAQFGVPLDPPAAPPPPSDIRHNPDLDDMFGR